MTRSWHWLLLAAALAQFVPSALPPGNDDLISIQSLALDISRGETELLYPGKNFSRNQAWIDHHTENLRKLGGRGEPNWCFYPPLIPWLASPLAGLGAEAWRLGWALLQFLLIIVFVLLIRRLLLFEFECVASLPLLFALVLGFYPVARDIELGQTSLLFALLFWSGVYLHQRSHKLSGALLSGIAIFTKPFLFIAELGRVAVKEVKRLLFIISAVAAFFLISILLLGWEVHKDYFAFLFTLSDSQTGFWGNQSLYGAALRLTGELPGSYYGFNIDADLARIGTIITLCCVVAAGSVQAFARKFHRVFSSAMWLSAILLGLPIAWEHHFIFLLPAIAALWIVLRSKVDRLFLTVATLLLALNLTPFYGDSIAKAAITILPMLGNLLLFILLSRYLILNSSRA